MPPGWIPARLPKCFLSRGDLLLLSPLRSPPLWAASIWPLSNLHVYHIIISPAATAASVKSVSSPRSLLQRRRRRHRFSRVLPPSRPPPRFVPNWAAVRPWMRGGPPAPGPNCQTREWGVSFDGFKLYHITHPNSNHSCNAINQPTCQRELP